MMTNQATTPESKKTDVTFSKGDRIRIGYAPAVTVEEFQPGEEALSGYRPAVVRYHDSHGYACWEHAHKCEAV